MASLQDIMNAPQRDKGAGFAVTMVHYSKLIPSETNNYSVGNIGGLAQAILLAGGVKHNLLARKKSPDEYELISGHRRRLAVKYITEELGRPGYEMLPVHVEKEGDLQAEVELILTNCSARERSDWEKMMEVDRLTELLTAMQDGTDEERGHFREIFGVKPGVTARELRRMVADKLGLSETRVANYNHINNSLVPELMEKFQAGEIGVTVANEAASLPEEDQRALAGQQDIRIADVRGMRPVSESDTEEQLPGQMDITDFPDILPAAIQTGQISVADMAAAGQLEELTIAGCAEAFWQNMYSSERSIAMQGQLSGLLKVLKTEYGGTYSSECSGRVRYECGEHRIDFFDIGTGSVLTCTWSELAMALIDHAGKLGGSVPDQPAPQESVGEEPAAGQQEPDQQPDGTRAKDLEAAGWYDETLLMDMIRWETKMLDDISKCGVDDDIAEMYAKRHMTVEALKGYLDGRRRQQADSWEERSKAQEPIPKLKNDDDRKAWIDRYRDWPVWFEVPQADRIYYRYDLPDGDSFVVCEEKYFVSWMADHKGKGWEPDRIKQKYYIIHPGYHYLADCEWNKTEFINKLKEIKKLI